MLPIGNDSDECFICKSNDGKFIACMSNCTMRVHEECRNKWHTTKYTRLNCVCGSHFGEYNGQRKSDTRSAIYSLITIMFFINWNLIKYPIKKMAILLLMHGVVYNMHNDVAAHLFGFPIIMMTFYFIFITVMRISYTKGILEKLCNYYKGNNKSHLEIIIDDILTGNMGNISITLVALMREFDIMSALGMNMMGNRNLGSQRELRATAAATAEATVPLPNINIVEDIVESD